MRIVELRAHGDLNGLAETTRDTPEPGPDEALVRLRAASLNFRDLVMVQGGYGRAGGALPVIPLSDGAGDVVAVGPDVDRVAVGDRVCPAFFEGWTDGLPTPEKLATALGGPRDGTLAEYRICREDALVRIPDHLDDAQAAALPCAAVTAWSALIRLGAIKAGDTVLIQGTGGVSLFALQFATLMGAETIVTSSSDAKLERVRSMGATHTINYRQEPEWGKLAAKLTGGRGVDLVVEVGGAGTLPQSLRAVRVGGQISLIGVLSGAMAELPLGPVVTREVRLQAVTLGSRQDFNDMMAAIDTGKLEPVVDRRFDFSEFRDAYAYLQTGQHFGKICIDIA